MQVKFAWAPRDDSYPIFELSYSIPGFSHLAIRLASYEWRGEDEEGGCFWNS